jgi:hypothetical protein
VAVTCPLQIVRDVSRTLEPVRAVAFDGFHVLGRRVASTETIQVGPISLLAVSLRGDGRAASVILAWWLGSGNGAGFVSATAAPHRNEVVHDKVLEIVSFEVLHDKVHGLGP